MKSGMIPMQINPQLLGIQGLNPMASLNQSQLGGIPIAVPGPNGAMMVMMPAGMNPQLQQQGSSSNNQGQSNMPNLQIPNLGAVTAASLPFSGMPNPFGMNLSQLSQNQNTSQNNQNPS